MKTAISSKKKELLVAYLFLVPILVSLFLFKFLPLGMAITESFRSPVFLGHVFVGLSNYLSLLSDPDFWNSVKVTLIFSLIVNPLQIGIALGLALLVKRRLGGIGVFRSVFFFPSAVSLTITAIIWGIMLNPDAGVANSFLRLFNIPKQSFLTSPRQALGSIILMLMWKGPGYWMMFLLAGLQGIPAALYESASIEGAGKLQTLTKITLPLLKRAIVFVLVADVTINFLIFAPVYILTAGGPMGSTNLLIYEVYNSAFVFADIPRAATVSSILIGMILVVALIQLKALRAQFKY